MSHLSKTKFVMDKPLVSIIINNYNYGKFLTEAIDSALNQTYSNVEVIVVDDGSTDNSGQVIASCGQQIISVLKKNGGQASALNAGFAKSRGEVVIFLDADDILLSETTERVVNIFQANPDVARVQYRLEIIDSQGRAANITIPPSYMPLPTGDYRQDLEGLVNSARTPTSGNAFSARALRQILPMPEAEFRLCADFYLLRVNAMCAPIVSLDAVGAYYRVHNSNGHFVSTLNLDQTRQNVAREHQSHHYIKCFTKSLDLNQYPEKSIDLPDEVFLAQRMISLKLDPAQHPIKTDTLLKLCWRGINVAARRRDLSLPLKLMHILWFIIMVPIPKIVAPVVAQQFVPETRVSLNKILNLFQSKQKSLLVNKKF